MDPNVLQQTLSQVEEHVSTGIIKLDRLRALILRLELTGTDSAPTREVLAAYEAAQAQNLAKRDQLLAQLGER